ncbi:hypothetical protein B0H11DRAFT_2227737 [Mycena galericulata]|nr:hypothetical protein B0H11DRAFT_2227737 [Mycena galericulata]
MLDEQGLLNFVEIVGGELSPPSPSFMIPDSELGESEYFSSYTQLFALSLGVVTFSSGGGEGKSSPFPVPTIGVYCHRSDLYEELLRLATGEGEGPPAQLRLGHKVVGCDPEAGTITLQTGEIVHADFIVGADGVNSVVRTHILGHVQGAPESGWSCVRIILETPTNLREMPELEWFHEGVAGARVITVKEGLFRMWGVFPIRNGTLINMVLFYADSPENEAGTPVLRKLPANTI